jgi:hypothetical protein
MKLVESAVDAEMQRKVAVLLLEGVKQQRLHADAARAELIAYIWLGVFLLTPDGQSYSVMFWFAWGSMCVWFFVAWRRYKKVPK